MPEEKTRTTDQILSDWHDHCEKCRNGHCLCATCLEVVDMLQGKIDEELLKQFISKLDKLLLNVAAGIHFKPRLSLFERLFSPPIIIIIKYDKDDDE